MKQNLLSQGPIIRRRMLLALVFGIPVLFARALHDPINVPKLGLLVAGVCLVGALRLAEFAQGASMAGLRRLTVPALAVTLPLLVAWIASPYKEWSLLGAYPRFGGLLPYLFAIALGVLLADAFPGRAREIGWAFATAGAVAGLYAVVQFAGLDPFEWTIKGGRSDQTSSTLGNPNFTGGFLAVVLPVSLGLLFAERERRKPAAILVGLIGAGLAVSSSQGAWLAGLTGAILFVGGTLANRRPGTRALSFIGAALLGLIALGTVGVTIFMEDPPVPETAERRGQWWEAAAAMGAEYPVLGRGPNAFAVEHARFRTPEDAAAVTSDITNDPHSVPLSFFANAGILGLLGFLVAVGWLIRRGASVTSDNVLAVGFAGAVGAYVVQSLVSIDTVALRTSLWIAAGGLIAATVAPSAAATTTRSKRRVRPASVEPLKGLPVVALAAAIVVAGIWGAWRIVMADRSFLAGQRAFADGDLNGAIEDFDQAVDRRGDYFYRQAYGRNLASAAVALSQSGETEVGRRLLGRSRELFAYTEDFPHVASIVDHARGLGAWSELEEPPDLADRAIELYTRAVLIDPKNAVTVNEATEYSRSHDDWDSLARFLRPAVEYLDDPNLWGTLALAYAHLGGEESSRLAIRQALDLDPTQGSALEAQVVLEAGTAPSN